MYGRDLSSVIEKIAQILEDKGEVFALTNVAFMNNFKVSKKIKQKPVPLELIIGDKKIGLMNYAQTLEEYKRAFMQANLTLEDEKYFEAVGLSVAPKYQYKNEINFKRGVFKLSKTNPEKCL